MVDIHSKSRTRCWCCWGDVDFVLLVDVEEVVLTIPECQGVDSIKSLTTNRPPNLPALARQLLGNKTVNTHVDPSPVSPSIETDFCCARINGTSERIGLLPQLGNPWHLKRWHWLCARLWQWPNAKLCWKFFPVRAHTSDIFRFHRHAL